MIYDVITAEDTGTLVNRVNAARKKGWKPQGGIAISIVGNGFVQAGGTNLLQAMVKEETK